MKFILSLNIKKSPGFVFQIIVTLGITVFLLSCSTVKDEKNDSVISSEEDYNITVDSPEPGYIYIDGIYTGRTTPSTFKTAKGNHTIGVALEKKRVYLKKENVEIGDELKRVELTIKNDLQEPKIWKALWVGINEATRSSGSSKCSSKFTKRQLDTGFKFFQWSIEKHFEPFSFGTMKWEITRKDITEPVQLTYANYDSYFFNPSTLFAHMPTIKAGDYDVIIIFMREKETCSFGPYFGLALTDPTSEETKKTGYVTIQFNAWENLDEAIDYYKENDPGVWMHEWLHTVGDYFYPSQGIRLPPPGPGGGVIHAAESYSYTFPWMKWYEDLISGKVKGPSGEYYGIGPEGLLKTTVREAALPNEQQR